MPRTKADASSPAAGEPKFRVTPGVARTGLTYPGLRAVKPASFSDRTKNLYQFLQICDVPPAEWRVVDNCPW